MSEEKDRESPVFVEVGEDAFNEVMEMIGEDVPFECDFCGKEVNKENFGIVHKEVKTCDNFVCKLEGIKKLEGEDTDA